MVGQKHSWLEVVALMRANVAEMGSDPDHTGRFLLRLAAAFDGLLIQYRRALGVGGSELQAVLALWDGGRMSMTDLGSRIGLSRAAVTTLSDRLERLDLIERVADTSDRRRILVSVTPKADQHLMQVMAQLHGEVAATIEPQRWASFVDDAAVIRTAARSETERLRALDSSGSADRPVRAASADEDDVG